MCIVFVFSDVLLEIDLVCVFIVLVLDVPWPLQRGNFALYHYSVTCMLNYFGK